MLWLGYAGMPRRIQDYPWGYAGWHSVASFGHTIVLLGIFFFLLSIVFAIYFKRPILSNNNGLPFISYRVCMLTLNINYSKQLDNKNEIYSVNEILDYLSFWNNYNLV
jgi:heme/copper-type cytochrome/quinol oxidase subunit 1